MWAKIIVGEKIGISDQKFLLRLFLLRIKKKGKDKEPSLFCGSDNCFQKSILGRRDLYPQINRPVCGRKPAGLQGAFMLRSRLKCMYSVCKQSDVFTKPALYHFTKFFCLPWLNIFLFKKQPKKYILYSRNPKKYL